MSDDWKAGDLAVCVNADEIDAGGKNGGRLVLGKVYKVLDVRPPIMWMSGRFDIGLSLDGPANVLSNGEVFHFWHPCRFRKVNPDTDACDREEWEAIMSVHKSGARQPA